MITGQDAAFGAKVLSASTGRDPIITDPNWTPPPSKITRLTSDPLLANQTSDPFTQAANNGVPAKQSFTNRDEVDPGKIQVDGGSVFGFLFGGFVIGAMVVFFIMVFMCCCCSAASASCIARMGTQNEKMNE